MYVQVEKPKENKGKAVANSIAQKKNNMKQWVGFVDNRPEAIEQRKRQKSFKNSVQEKTECKLFGMSDDSIEKQFSIKKKGNFMLEQISKYNVADHVNAGIRLGALVISEPVTKETNSQKVAEHRIVV